MKAKVFQFDPKDYNTTYEVVKGIYIYGHVVDLGKQVAIEYTYEWQLMSLFSQIPNTTYVAPPPPESVRHPWDKTLTVVLAMVVIAVALYLILQ